MQRPVPYVGDDDVVKHCCMKLQVIWPVSSIMGEEWCACFNQICRPDLTTLSDQLLHALLRRWGFETHDMQHILGHAERECWLPDLVW